MLYIFLILGFVFLLKGADFLVRGAAVLAGRLGVSNLFIGATLVAFGTTAPELLVNMASVLKGSTDLAMSNVVGSVITNTLFIIGCAALYKQLRIKDQTWNEILYALGAIVVLIVLSTDKLLTSLEPYILSRIDGLILLLLFVFYLKRMISVGRVKNVNETSNQLGGATVVMYIAVGLAGLLIGGKWVVDGALALTQVLQLSERAIGGTVVAIGTSLPELATAFAAVRHRKFDLAIGDVIGANVINVGLILGLTAIIKPLSVSQDLVTDLLFAFMASMLILILAEYKKTIKIINHWQGLLLITSFVGYVVFSLIRS